MLFLVQLEDGVYLAAGRGDPARTLCFEKAKIFYQKTKAEKALSKARKFRPFERAKLVQID